MIALALDSLSWVLLTAGGAFLLIGSIGMVRLPDFYSRLHTAGISDTLGITLVLLGLVIQAGVSLVSIKILFILVFLFFSSPTSTHLLAKGAMYRGLKPWIKSSAPSDSKDDPPSST